MRSFILYFIKYPIAANLLMVGLFLMGIFGMLNMKTTFFPEVESRNISIQTVLLGASPEEIEEGIITKIEDNLKGVSGVEEITSVSRENSGTVSITVLKGYDPDLVLEDVKNAVERIPSFPAAMEPAVVYKRETLGFAISFALSGKVDLRTLKEKARKVEEELRAQDGISKIELSGFPDEEIEITFREADLRSYNITFDEATRAVRGTNLEITGGTIKGQQEELLIRARNKEYYAEELRDIVIRRVPNGGVIRLYQIADIEDRWADNPNRSYLNGAPSVVVTIQNTLEEDMLSINDYVRNYLEEFNKTNTDIQANIIRDNSTVLVQRRELLTENGILGFLIVMVLLAMFLHWRLAFWVALAIPISFAGMFICAYLLDVTINVISLFGMILVIGILVDDGIVIGENIYQMHERGVPRMKAAIDGTMQVLPAVFSAIITTIIAFCTFYLIDGRLGDFFAEMATVVIFSLVFSLVEGALILPTHVAHSKALAEGAKPNMVTKTFDRVMDWMRFKIYAPVLRSAMANKVMTLCVMTAGLIMTVGAIAGGLVQTTFFPIIERDNFTVTLKMPAGTREHITEQWLAHIEQAVWTANEQASEKYFNNEKQAIEQVEKKLGPSTHEGVINVTVLDSESRDSLKVRELTNMVRRIAGPIYDAEVVTYGTQSVFGKPVSLSLLGNDYKELDQAKEEVKAALNELSGLADVVDNNQEGLREVNIRLKEKAFFLGLSLEEVLRQVRQGFFGSEVQRLQRGIDEVRVWVRYDQQDRSGLSDLKNMRIRFADGREFPLSEIAEFSVERGIIAINHFQGKREVKVEADVSSDDVSVSDLTALIKNDIVPPIVAKYPTVVASFEGQNKEQQKSQKSMQRVLPIIFGGMFFVIALTFRSTGQSLIVFALIPFGLIGVGWGHWLMSAPISLFSVLGIIALIGILVNDALVFITAYNDNIKEGMPHQEAVYETGLSRFRPILLTSVTTFAGLAPLLAEKSLQAQFLIPMAISVAFGLLAITVIILLLLPVLLLLVNRIKVYSIYAWEGEKPSAESVEPAIEGRQSYFFLWLTGGLISIGVFIGLIQVFFRIVGQMM